MGGGVGKGVQRDVEEIPQEYLSSIVEESFLQSTPLADFKAAKTHGSSPL